MAHPASTPADRPQTPAQWAVRWHGLAAAALLAGSVPLVHLVWHGLLGRAEPPIVTRSQTPAPALVWTRLADGTWMHAEERHLQEASPVAWWLRGAWNELLLLAGAPQSERVEAGAGGFLFLRAEVEAPAAALRERRDARLLAFAAVRDFVRAAGAELLVAIVPDKSRVYADLVAGGAARTAGKQPQYGELLADLRACGIDAVDLAGALAARRLTAPDELLYYRGDSHWRPFGALGAAQAVAAALEARPAGARLGPRGPVQLGPSETYEALGDLVALLGLRTAELPARDGRRTVGLSLAAHGMRELRTYWSITAADPAFAARLDGSDPEAEVWLAGTSFTNESFWRALVFALGRPVRVFQDNGAGGIVPMRRVLGELAAPGAPRPKVVVWEIVERGFFEDGWRAPGF